MSTDQSSSTLQVSCHLPTSQVAPLCTDHVSQLPSGKPTLKQQVRGNPKGANSSLDKLISSMRIKHIHKVRQATFFPRLIEDSPWF